MAQPCRGRAGAVAGARPGHTRCMPLRLARRICSTRQLVLAVARPSCSSSSTSTSSSTRAAEQPQPRPHTWRTPAEVVATTASAALATLASGLPASAAAAAEALVDPMDDDLLLGSGGGAGGLLEVMLLGVLTYTVVVSLWMWLSNFASKNNPPPDSPELPDSFSAHLHMPIRSMRDPAAEAAAAAAAYRPPHLSEPLKRLASSSAVYLTREISTYTHLVQLQVHKLRALAQERGGAAALKGPLPRSGRLATLFAGGEGAGVLAGVSLDAKFRDEFNTMIALIDDTVEKMGPAVLQGSEEAVVAQIMEKVASRAALDVIHDALESASH